MYSGIITRALECAQPNLESIPLALSQTQAFRNAYLAATGKRKRGFSPYQPIFNDSDDDTDDEEYAPPTKKRILKGNQVLSIYDHEGSDGDEDDEGDDGGNDDKSIGPLLIPSPILLAKSFPRMHMIPDSPTGAMIPASRRKLPAWKRPTSHLDVSPTSIVPRISPNGSPLWCPMSPESYHPMSPDLSGLDLLQVHSESPPLLTHGGWYKKSAANPPYGSGYDSGFNDRRPTHGNNFSHHTRFDSYSSMQSHRHSSSYASHPPSTQSPINMNGSLEVRITADQLANLGRRAGLASAEAVDAVSEQLAGIMDTLKIIQQGQSHA